MLQFGFLLLTMGMGLILCWLAAKVAAAVSSTPTVLRKFIVGTAAVLLLWLLYVGIISAAGVLATSALPPRVPLLLVLPAFVLIGFFLLSRRFSAFIKATPGSWLVHLQAFRVIVELLIWGVYQQGIFPKSATFEGHNYDVVIGFTAPLVAYLYFTRRAFSRRLLVAWNILGLCTLLIVVATLMAGAYGAAGMPKQTAIINQGLGIFPYAYLPGFLMPLAVFLHLFTLRKLKDHDI